MAEKSLLSLREIAQELYLNYRMMLNYKNQLQGLLPIKDDGNFTKYPSDCIDLFRLVAALREEGYTFEMIRKLLGGQQEPPEDVEVNEWITMWVNKLAQINLDQSRSAQIAPEQSGEGQINPELPRSAQSDPELSGSRQIDPGQSGSTQTDPDQSKLLQIEEKLEAEIERVEEQLSGLVPTINACVTAFYRAIHELQITTSSSINNRLRHLESELNVQSGPELELTELDLEQLQVQLTPEPQTSHADLDFVRASISDGKPNKDAIVQWVWAEREKDPSISYARLAEILDREGVPTLSGRDGWNRTSLRNLAAKSKE